MGGDGFATMAGQLLDKLHAVKQQCAAAADTPVFLHSNASCPEWVTMRESANELWSDCYGARDERRVPSGMAEAYDSTLRGLVGAKEMVIGMSAADRHELHTLLQCGICRCRIECILEGWNYEPLTLLPMYGDTSW